MSDMSNILAAISLGVVIGGAGIVLILSRRLRRDSADHMDQMRQAKEEYVAASGALINARDRFDQAGVALEATKKKCETATDAASNFTGSLNDALREAEEAKGLYEEAKGAAEDTRDAYHRLIDTASAIHAEMEPAPLDDGGRPEPPPTSEVVTLPSPVRLVEG